MKYTIEQIEEKVKNPSMLYQREVINYAGKSVEGKRYTEIVASILLEKLENSKIEDVLATTHKDVREDFAFKNHDGKTENKESNRREERFCLGQYGKISPWGKIINYQVNIIIGTKVNVDLVSYDSDNKILTMIEVKGYEDETKKPTSTETLLRCILEIQTYFLLIGKVKEKLFGTLCAADGERVARYATELKKAVWVPENSRAWKEYKEMENGKRPELKKLIDMWDIKIESMQTNN